MKSFERVLKKRILNFGPISISDFMAEANQNPKFGYYKKIFPFGKKGDFITAPEISQMFGELIGIWIIDSWKKLGQPNKFNIIELGPGTGNLMIDITRTLNLNKNCANACKKIYLLETSKKLRMHQKKNFLQVNYKLLKKISWIENTQKIKKEPFIIVANEFFDALPIKQLQYTKNGWREILVNFNNKENFYYTLSNNPTLLEKFIPNIKKKIGEIYEIPIQSLSLINELFKKFNQTKGNFLIIDYEKKNTYGNTLKSIKNHKKNNPLTNIGISDLSVHVDFELIKKISKNFKLNFYGPISQRNFLIKLGILLRAKMLKKNASQKQKQKINNSLKFLINKNKMGECFQVVSISNLNNKKPEGFF